MTHVTRRTFTLGATAAATALPLTLTPGLLPAQAKEAMPAAAPSLYGAHLGNYRITALFDGMVPLQKEFFFGPEQSEIDAALAASGAVGDALPVPVTAYLLQSSERTILIDAGMGEIDMFGDDFGQILPGLAALGLRPADVDTVVLTHAHPDHLGGLLAGGAAVFGNPLTMVRHGTW